jgi:outer membrane murein-binding lipoprotein Lpp
MTRPASDSVAHDLQLTTDETLVLTALQHVMLGRDLIAEKSQPRIAFKTGYRNEFAAGATTAYWARSEELPAWAVEHATAIAAKAPAHQRSLIETAAADFGRHVTQRSRALQLMIELTAFQPWAEQATWVPRARRDALGAVASYLPALRAGDRDAVQAEFAAVSRAVAHRNVRWGRLAAASAAGLVLGIATMGAAAPLIGAAVGGALGMSGAAATSAGLAFLGGGSLAAGGFGMAGGTALLAGAGALGGAGAAAAGSRWTGWSAGQVVIDAIKLDVVARLVILDAEGDDEKARRVVEGLQARLDEVSSKVRQLSEQIRALRAENQRLSAENEQLRAQWEAERDDATMAETALQVVIGRIPVHA